MKIAHSIHWQLSSQLIPALTNIIASVTESFERTWCDALAQPGSYGNQFINLSQFDNV